MTTEITSAILPKSNTSSHIEGTQYDLIFYSPEHKKTRIQYLKRLTNEEMSIRRLDHGVSEVFFRQFPDQFQGKTGYTQCNISCRFFYGAPDFIGGYPKFYDYVENYVVIAKGLIGANIKPEFFESEDYKTMASGYEGCKECADNNLQNALNEDQERDLTIRYLRYIANRVGINISNMTGQDIIDIVDSVLMEPQYSHFPSLDQWKAVRYQDLTLPPVTYKGDSTLDRDLGELYMACQNQRQTVNGR